MRIISLSSIPPRFPFLSRTLNTLLAQDGVDEIRLYIPKTYRRFPNYDGSLPTVPRGIKVIQVEDDLGPATKVLPASKEFRGEDVQILFCDDDLIYHQYWAKKLFDVQAQRPQEAVATYGRSIRGNLPESFHKTPKPEAKSIPTEKDIPYRFQRLISKIFHTEPPLWRPIVRAGYVDMLFGVGGVVVRPDFFDDEAWNIPEEAWMVDDVWLSAQLARRGIPIYCPRRFPFAKAADHSTQDSLLDSGDRQSDNRRAAIYCREKYGIWK